MKNAKSTNIVCKIGNTASKRYKEGMEGTSFDENSEIYVKSLNLLLSDNKHVELVCDNAGWSKYIILNDFTINYGKLYKITIEEIE